MSFSHQNDASFQLIAVGQAFPLFPNMFSSLRGGDGTFSEADPDNHGFFHVTAYRHLSKDELHIFLSEPVYVRLFKSEEGSTTVNYLNRHTYKYIYIS